MTTKNEHNETIILTPEQEAIKRLEDKLKESKFEIKYFEDAINELKYKSLQHLWATFNDIQKLYDFKSEYLSLKSYATTVVDLFKKK
jgi:hypothetical protein